MIRYGLTLDLSFLYHLYSAFYNNTLVMTGTNVGSFTCSGPGKTIVHDNHIYTADGTATECGASPPKSPGTSVAKYPSDAELIGWAAQMLGVPQH